MKKDSPTVLSMVYSDLPPSLDFLIRKSPIADDEYYLLIDYLTNLIYRQRESIIQEKLGAFDSQANHTGSFGPLSNYTIPATIGLPLSTLGIWFCKFYVYPAGKGYRELTVDGHTAKFRNEVDHYWGYTRNGHWAVSEISYLREEDDFGLKRAPYTQILKVDTKKVSGPKELTSIVGIGASDIYWMLTLAIGHWYGRRRELYNAATLIHEQVTKIAQEVSRIHKGVTTNHK